MATPKQSLAKSTWAWIVASVVSWTLLLTILVLAPFRFEITGGKSAMRVLADFGMDHPSATTNVSTSREFLANQPLATVFVLLSLIAGQIFLLRRLDGKINDGLWLLRLCLVTCPLAPIPYLYYGVHLAPRQALAAAFEMERLPQYDRFPTYLSTAGDPMQSSERRREALYSLHVMCCLEQIGISPPANRQQDSTPQTVDAYLFVCQQDSAPIGLQRFAAARLHRSYIEGKLVKFPNQASTDEKSARRLVANVYLKVVANGGPSEAWETYQPGDFAESAFQGLSPTPEILQRLSACLSDPSDAVRAEAAAALGAIGATNDNGLVFESLKTAINDPNERVRQYAEKAMQQLLASRENTKRDSN